jgi:short subunit dehydrogenase-like uncharacterized protein
MGIPWGMARRFDLVVYGASGFTGRLVAEYLQVRYGSSGSVVWAMAGRNLEKLAQVRAQIGAEADVPLIAADAHDGAALLALAHQARAVITTVGPYQLGGEPLLRACIESGTDYLDLCGEPAWMARMIRTHHRAAEASGARVVFSCGFDSVPFDLGVLYLQHEAMVRHGKPLPAVSARVLVMKGGFSGGTAASLLATVQAMGEDPGVRADMRNPFALTPGFTGPEQPEGNKAAKDDTDGVWSGPFVMAPINTKTVHRTNYLLGHAFGRDFRYAERMSFGVGPAGEVRAKAAARNDKVQALLLGFGPTRRLIKHLVLPKPGTGPSAEEREAGRYRIAFTGTGADGEAMTAVVEGDRDPGYGSTSKIIAECALGLLHDVDPGSTRGGIWTPGAALGMAVIPRLQERAGLSFRMSD